MLWWMAADVTALLSLLWHVGSSRDCAGTRRQCFLRRGSIPPPSKKPGPAECSGRGQKGSLGDVVVRGAYVVKTATKGMVLVPAGSFGWGAGTSILKNAQSMRLP